MSAGKIQKERFHFLDGLRAIAATMVVILHSIKSFLMKTAAGGTALALSKCYIIFLQSGVELFFVLSGVVLLRPYLRGEKKLQTGDYFLRRFKRIYPTYFFALVFGCFVIYYNSCFPSWYTRTAINMEFSWVEAFREAFLISFYERYYNMAWWSLGIEAVFYIIVPLLILVFPRKNNITQAKMYVMLFATLAIATVIQFFLNAYCPSIYSLPNSSSTVFKFVEYPLCFLLGTFLAAKDFTQRDAMIFFILAFIFMVGAVWYLPFVHSGFGFFYAAIIILSFNSDGLKRFLSAPFMVWLGERSYSLFLVHFSVFYLVNNIVSHFVPERNMTYNILTRVIGLSGSLFVAMILFTLVERKFARGLVTDKVFWPWQVKPKSELVHEVHLQKNS